MARKKKATKMTNESGIVGDGKEHPKEPTMLEIFTDPAKYAGDTRKDPVLKEIPIQALVGEGKFIQDHATGDTWNPMHEPFNESDQNVSAPTRGGQSGLRWSDFYRGAPKSALHWYRLQLRDQNGGVDPGAEFMQEFLKKLATSQKRELGIL